MKLIGLFLPGMKQWLSYLLIMLFSFQALPVKELGKLLLKKAAIEQTADETEEDAGAAKELKEKAIEKLYLQAGSLHFNALIADDLAKIALHQLSILAPSFYPDITTPPPDRASC